MDWDVKTGKVSRGKVRGIMFIFCGLGDMDLEFENGVTDLKSYFLLWFSFDFKVFVCFRDDCQLPRQSFRFLRGTNSIPRSVTIGEAAKLLRCHQKMDRQRQKKRWPPQKHIPTTINDQSPGPPARGKKCLLVLLVPGIEGLLGIGLVLKDAQQVAVAEGIDGLGQVAMLIELNPWYHLITFDQHIFMTILLQHVTPHKKYMWLHLHVHLYRRWCTSRRKNAIPAPKQTPLPGFN